MKWLFPSNFNLTSTEETNTSTKIQTRLTIARKTWVMVENTRIDLQGYYDDVAAVAAVSYRTYWQRVRGLRLRGGLDSVSLDNACVLNAGEWITFYGGGRRKGFTYLGEELPDQAGMHFSSVTALLRTIGRYDERALIWSRLKSGWGIDHALSIPKDISIWRPGLIYKVIRKSTGQVYVGLTVCGVDQRWSFHLSAARRGSKAKLARAIREDGDVGFLAVAVEEGITDAEALRQREIYWVAELGALGENGLNVAQPGGLGGSRGKPTTVDGRRCRSLQEAAHVGASNRGIAHHVALNKLRKGLPIPDRARVHSRHPDVGTNLFRRWLALNKRHPGAVEPVWRENYDAFKADVGFNDPTLSLARADDAKPWGPSNFLWLTNQELVEKTHGKGFTVLGVWYPSLKAIARAFSIGCSTLKNRIYAQGMSIEEAVTRPVGVTSYKRSSGDVELDGQKFRSERQAQLCLIREKGLTEYAARLYFQKLKVSG